MASSSASPSTSRNPPGSISASTSSHRPSQDEETQGPSRRRRTSTPTVHRWTIWDEVEWQLYGVGGGTRRWKCHFCGYSRAGGSHKVRAHFLHEPGNEVRFCTKITPEKRQEDAATAESARRNARVAVDPNTMAPTTSTPRRATSTMQPNREAPTPSRPPGAGTSTRPRQTTLQQNWNPRLKEETDMAVARFFFHDHIAFNAAR